MIQKYKNLFLKVVIIWILFFAVLFFVAPVLAQAPALDTGLDYAKATGLVDTDIRIIIARIVNVALGLLGIVALALVIYGGWMYMTAAGNEEQITKAKKILLDAGIGLAIILSAFAITQFVISKLTDAIMSQYKEDQQPPLTCTETGCPSGLQNLFYSASAPQGKLTIKNVTVSIVFMGNWGFAAEYDKETVPPIKPENIKIVKKTDQTSAPGDFSLKNASQIDFNPTGSCADASNPVNSDASNICFEKNTTYQVILNTSIKSINGLFLECSTAHPCVGEFITGEKMDITPPAISLNLPGQNALLPVDSKVEVSANYSDDAGVKMVSFQQDGKKIQDKIINPPEIQGIISTLWNTGIKAPAIYNLTAIAADVDNHETTSAAQTVKILPAYCFDTIKTENTDEIGVDCGPTCGACAGSNCQAALDCAKGFTCNASNICVKQTKITNIEPKDGAIGNYVTIWGENFGVYDAVKSKVKFLGNAAGQEKEGKILSCDNKYTWKDNFIVVEVPVGAQNGPLQVFTATSTPDPFFQDRTDDKIGPYFDPANVFTVNDKIKPGLGCLKPVQGKPKESVQAEGINFGGTQGTSQFLFGIAPAAPVSWSPAFLNAAVPELPAQDLSVTVKVGDKISNPLPFKISEGVKVFPHISSLDPEEGPADSYVTISGNDFGSQTGKVIFYEDNNPFTADLADCSKNWSDTQIIAKVPFKMKNYSDKVKATVQVVTYENLKSNMQVFTVDNSKIKGPQLCSITPNNGPIDTLIKLTGSFGWDLGKIEYWKSITSTIYTDGGESWQDKEIADKVEKGAKTGSVKVWSDKLKAYSNHAVFKVQNCQEELKKGEALEKVCGLDNKCCGAGSCVPKNDLCPGEAGLKASIYAWSFTTGQMPLVPEMVKECQPGKVPSPSPGFNADKNLQPPPTNVCVNAIIKTQFTTLVKNVDSSFIVEKCIDAVCSSASKVDGKLDLTLVDGNIGETGNDMATFAPSNMWTPDTWYRVTLTTDIQSDAENSANMSPASEGQCVNPPNKIASDCFSFKTKNSLELCKLGSAVVSPNPFTAKQYDALYYPGDKTLYNVSAIAKDNVCWAIDANAYDWKWNAGKSAGINIVSDYATISNDQASGGVETVATALKSSVNFSNLSKEFKQDVQTMFNLAKHLIMKDKQYVLATFETPDAIVAIDITDSAKPTAAGQFEFKDKSISSLAVSGDFAYVLTNPKNLSVLNITDLKNIKLTATVANDPSKIDLNSAIDLVAKNQFVILSDNVSHRLRVLNVSNLQNIVSVGSLQNGESGAKLYGANKMFLIGNYLYVLAKDGAEGSFGIEVVDVSQVPKLSPVKFIPLQSNAQLLFANSQHLFASFDEGGLLGKRSIAIFDASKGFSSAGILSAPYTNGIYASDKYLFLSFKDASNEYVKVYDISDSTKPITVGTLKDENLKNPAVINGTNNQALIVSNPSGFVYLFNVVGLDVTSNILKGKPEQDLTTKDKETQPKESVWAQTGSGNNSVEDWAELSVSVNKPKVIDKWPDCPSACINAGIGALFSQDLDDASIKAPAITLCSVPAFNGSCQTFLTVNPVKIATSTIDLQYSGVLSPNQYYRVIIQGGENGVKGKSGAILDPEFLNYQCDGEEKNCQSFSWTFRTKNETDVCDIKTVKVMPSSVIVNWIGDNASYFSQAEGAPSQCNAFGEKLNSWVYNWNWTSKETKVATVNNFDITVGAALGCSTACAHLGSSPAPTGGYCGNDIVDIGEQCDPPDPFGNVCNSKCLNVNNVNKGTLPCVDVSKQNCCGNGGPFAKAEQDEDCDLGLEKNGQPGSGCTGNCLFSGTPVSFDICVNNLKMSEAKCSEVGAIAVCGNGEIEPGEDCDGSDNCGKNCLWKNKKENFNSLYCGNGVVDKGEDCDFVGVGDGKIDPWQFATAVGKGTVTNGQQKTEIMAIAKEKSGAADFILQCGFSPVDAKCPVGVMTDYFGIGKNSCCYARPTVKLIQPSTPPVPTNVCTNTAMTLKFSEVMDIGTFNSSTLGYFNIILAESTSTPNCPSGTFQVAQEIEKTQGWWNKIMVWFKKLLGQPAKANIYCAGGVDYTLISTTINDGTEENSALKTQVSLDLKNPLAGLTDYKIIVTKDVKSAAGLSLLMPYGAGPQIPPYSVSFKTQKDLCKIDNIKIDPEAWWFNTNEDEADNDPSKTAEFDTKNDVDKMFSPHAYFTPTNSPPQELQSVIGYTWAYNWAIGDNSIVEKGVLVGVAQEFKAKNKNGITQVGATAQISDGTQKSASSTVEVFICENPWPDATFNVAHSEFGLGYIDAEGTDDGILPDNGWTNFKLMYCRDAGKPNDPSDDLPELNKPTVVSHKNDASGIFKEFFATFAPPPTSTDIKEDKNSIGLRVYSNINHLPLVKWYQAVPAEAPGSPTVKGAPTPAQVGPYKALQEGRTYYIDGLNSSTDAAGKTTLYSNIYVFSFSDNPTAETLNIVNQLLANFTLNVNVADKDVVGKMYRDYTRLQDLKLIADKLWSYYQDPKKGNGAYPKLTENPQLGTFLPSYTNSKWKSWQGVLGNLVGYTLPVDPLNGFNGCANSTLSVGTPPVNLGPFDAETCWNAANSTFVCPSGSQVYEYETTGGTEAKLKADFELPQYIWNKKLVDLKPASPCEPNNCQITSGKCTNNNDACLKDSDCSLDVCTAIVKRCVVDNKICASDSDCVPSSCDLDYQISGNCNNTVEGNSIKCGDGIVGSGEKCEIGAQQYLDCSISGYPGKQSQKCKADCSNWENAGSCVPQGKCGDGVKQGAEKCDDGKNNGKYGYCKTDCSGTSAEFCGNNKLDTGKEACDLNGAVYNAQKDLSCSWDCQNWDYCGDGVVHKPYEQCEKSESCQVGTCDDSYKSIEKKEGFCEKDSDCVVSQPVQVPLPQGGTKAVQQVQNPDAKCLDYKSGKRYCGVATEFIPVDAPGHSPPYYYKDSDTKFSGYSGESYINCDWWGTDTFIDNRASNSVTCLPLEKPTAPTIPSSCGNGKIEAGEVCDDGANNGVECDWIANAKTCTYCAFGCQQVITKTKP